jgi:hypothetical protein
LITIVRRIMGMTGLLLTLAVPSAYAAPQALYTTAYLQHLCSSTYDIDVGMCAGYIMSVADDLQQQGQVCLTGQVGPAVLMDNIRRSWTQTSNQPTGARQSVGDILQQRFPCR